jgi:phage-related protein
MEDWEKEILKMDDYDSLAESFKEKVVDLFQPYKTGTHVYFTDIAHKSIYEDINNITINARSIYGSIYNYKGINLDFTNCKIFNDVAASPWNYSKDDIFYYKSSVYSQRGYYYYTGANLTNAILDATYQPLGNTSWFTKEFYFKTDLEYDINSAIRLINTEFNNSTSAIIKDGINYNTLEIPLKFSKRTNKEARSILKFLDSHGGYKIFDYTLPQPYNKTIKVYCPEWNHTYNFFDNHDIDVKLIESKYATVSHDIVYNTLLSPYTFGKEYCPFAPFVPPDTVPEDDPEIPPPDIPPGGGINFFKMKIYLWSDIANVGGIANVQQIAIANIKEGVNKETFFGTVNGLGVIGAVPSGPCPISDPSSPAYTPNDACDTDQGFITVYFNEKYLIYGTTDTNAIQIAWLYTGSGPTDPLLITTVITHSEIIARYTSLQTAYLDDPTLKDDVLAMGYETYCQFKRLTAA